MVRRDFFRGLFGGAAVMKLPGVKSAEILRIEPDDIIVITVRGHPTQQVLEEIYKRVQPKFSGHTVLVKDDCIDISTIKIRS